MEYLDFKEAASRHQVKYRVRNIGCDYNQKDTWLTDKDSMLGKNFYNGFSIFNMVKKKHPISSSIYFDMLCSDHILYDLFVPFRHELIFLKHILNEYMGDCIKSIDRNSLLDMKENIKIQYAAPNNNLNPISNHFNVYIEYTHKDNTKGVISIDVKYIQNENKVDIDPSKVVTNNKQDTLLYKITKESDIYKTETLSELKGETYRQLWKNQLLVESMRLNYNNKFNHSTLFLIYPEDNSHFKKTSDDYTELLISNDTKFKAITFEDFIIKCNRYCPNTDSENWIEYLEKRYLIKKNYTSN